MVSPLRALARLALLGLALAENQGGHEDTDDESRYPADYQGQFVFFTSVIIEHDE